MPAPADNPYTRDPVFRTFVRTALPVILLTSVNGLLTVADAMILGVFVGPDALTAVTMVFPVSMLLIALATMASTGMASILGRSLGAGSLEDGRRILAGAHGLSLCLCAGAMALFAGLGGPLTVALADGDAGLAAMGHRFLSISVYTSPLLLLLSVHSDALRTEGRVGFMAIAGLLVSVANIAFNYALVVWCELGIAGSAWGTALAQGLALATILFYRMAGRTQLSLAPRDARSLGAGWPDILALGAPRSLSFIGIALSSAMTVLALRLFGGPDGDASIAAYGVIGRVMMLAYFPLLGMTLALQAMVANNHGAGLPGRSDATLRLALICSIAYCCLVEAGLVLSRHQLGGLFVSDPLVGTEIAGILPLFTACYFTFGATLMIAGYFQSIGDVRHAMALSLARGYLFIGPLTFLLPLLAGKTGIWLATPTADLLLVLLTLWILKRRSGRFAWRLSRIT